MIPESAAEPASFRQWHTDGDNFTSLTPLYGPGPWATLDRSMAGRKAQPNDQAIKVLRGQMLYLSGNRRSEIEATTHTTPPIDANRALLVTRHVG